MTSYTHIDSPLGSLLALAEDGALTGLYYPDHRRGRRISADWVRDDGAFAELRTQLGKYFAGGRREFALAYTVRGTPFQRDVWSAMAAIGFARTATYGELATALGRPAAARAVGAAVGRNPISIVLPCHRVVGSSGRLTGYAGGTERKRHLLTLEAAAVGQQSLSLPVPRG